MLCYVRLCIILYYIDSRSRCIERYSDFGQCSYKQHTYRTNLDMWVTFVKYIQVVDDTTNRYNSRLSSGFKVT